jgi:hypothetical protein
MQTPGLRLGAPAALAALATSGAACRSPPANVAVRAWDRTAYVDAAGMLPTVVALAAGDGTSYALLSTGDVVRWGAGSPLPLPVRGVAHAVQIAAYHSRACALLAEGGVSCWGANVWGETVPGDSHVELEDPTGVPGVHDADEIAMAEHFTCVRLRSGRVDCWGLVDRPQPPSCTSPLEGHPIRDAIHWHPQDVDDAVRIVAGRRFMCDLRRAGTVSCWGHGGAVPSSNVMGSPRDMGLQGVARIAAAGELACAWRSDGQALCWGAAGTHFDSDRPARWRRLDGAAGIAAPLRVGGCAWYGDGRVGCAGWNDVTHHEEEGWFDGFGSHVVEVVAGDEHMCARDIDGAVRCNGRDAWGAVGDLGAVRVRPVHVAEGGTAVFARGNLTCLRDLAGVRCWGVLYGHDDVSKPPPRASLAALQPHRIEIGRSERDGEYGCLLLDGGEVRCFSETEWRAPFPGPAADVAVNDGDACAVLMNGELWCLSVSERQGAAERIAVNADCGLAGVALARAARAIVHLRDGTVREVDLHAPRSAFDPGIAGATMVRSQGCTACARSDDGVRCWAIKGCSRGLFVDDPLASPQPHLVEGLDGARAIAVGTGFVCGVLADGSVACAGSNRWGQLGDGTLVSRAAAHGVEGLSNVSSLAAGASHVCALSGDARLSCWGNAQWGQLGDGRLRVRVAWPVRVHGLP